MDNNFESSGNNNIPNQYHSTYGISNEKQIQFNMKNTNQGVLGKYMNNVF